MSAPVVTRPVRLVAVAVAWTIVAVIAALPAGAAQADAVGWWWRSQTGLLGVRTPHPTVPDDGIAVAMDTEPQATAAVRFVLAESETDPVLVLDVADDTGGGQAAIRACPTDVRWRSAEAGQWDDRPPAHCDVAEVSGERSVDGSTWTFALAPMRDGETLNVVLLPSAGAPPFQVAFEQPTGASLRTTTEEEDFDAPDPEAFGDAEHGEDGEDGDGTGGGAAAGDDNGGGAPRSGTGPAPPAVSVQPGHPEQEPVVAPPDADDGSGGQTQARAGTDTGDGVASRQAVPPTGRERLFGTMLLVASVISLGALLGERAPSRFLPGVLARLRRDPGDTDRGLGRFARPRTEPPPPLI